MDAVRARRWAGALLVALVVLAGCGGSDTQVRGYLDDTFGNGTGSGDTRTYSSPDPVGTVTARIADAVRPAARAADGGNEYLRYDDDIVTVSPATNGSSIRVEDLDRRYRSGFFAYLGPGFTPGSPAGGASDGGPGDAK
ncbi:DUF4247 domain-containing protein [Geodermatophilus sp. SYSU D00815]